MKNNKVNNAFMYCGDTLETNMIIIGDIDGEIVIADKDNGNVYKLERNTYRFVPIKLKVVEE